MSANLEAKKSIVAEIKEKIQASKSIVLADYNKLTVLEVTALRNKFKEANCEYKVYKNTLVRKAFNELGITDCFSVKLEAVRYVYVLVLVSVHNSLYVVEAEPDRVKKNGNVDKQNTYNEGGNKEVTAASLALVKRNRTLLRNF